MQTRSIGYWTSTLVLVFVLISGGYGELTHQWGTLETASVLGYPLYFLTIIGAWKIAGGIVLLVPRVPRLREWAYAGIFFNMTGAAASHVFANDFGPGAFHVLVPLTLAALALVSCALWPRTAAVRSAGLPSARRTWSFGSV